MIKNWLFFSMLFLHYLLPGQSFTVTYGFPEVSPGSGMTDPSQPPAAVHLQFGAFSAHGTASQPNASGRFSFTGWPAGGLNGSDDPALFTGALSPTVYYEVSIQVHPGYTLSLHSLDFSVRRSGTGIRNYCVRSDRDHYIHNLSATTGTATRLSVLPGNVFFWNYDSVPNSSDLSGSRILPGPAFGGISGSVSFRFYAWNAETSGGSFSIDNVSFSGITGPASDSTGLTDLPAPVSPGGSIRLFPNPCRGITRLEGDLRHIHTIALISPEGACVWRQDGFTDPGSPELDLSSLPPGMYSLRLWGTDVVLSRRLLILD